MTLALFVSAAALLVYVYAGYPVAVWLWARLRPRPVRSAPIHVPVCIIVVVHNEAGRIGAKLDTCLQQQYPPDLLRVLVVSDGSTDETHRLVQEHADGRVKLLGFGQRRGKAACLVDAINHCTEPVLVLTDARQELSPDAVAQLVAHLADPQVGAVSGELVFRSDRSTGFSEGLGAYWHYEKFIRRHEALVDSTIGVTGALYALRRSAFVPIAPQTILDDVAIPMGAVMQGARVSFESRAIAYDEPALDVARERLRKVRTLAGNFQLLAMYPAWLLPWNNRVWVQFMSHKVLRLAAPVALGVLMLTNLLLLPAGALFQLVLVGQVVFYVMAVGGHLYPPALRWRLVKLAGTFVALNWFVVLGFIEFVRNRDAHLWKSKVSG